MYIYSVIEKGAFFQFKIVPSLYYRRIVYGNNNIVVQLQSIIVLLLLEVLNPFYIFQVFTVALWLAEDYLYYTIAIILMSLFGITSTIIQTRKVCTYMLYTGCPMTRGPFIKSVLLKLFRVVKLSNKHMSPKMFPNRTITIAS